MTDHRTKKLARESKQDGTHSERSLEYCAAGNLKGRLFKSMVRPAMLYGMAAVPVTKVQEKKMKEAEMRKLQLFALGKMRLDRIRSSTIRKITEVGDWRRR